MKFQTFAASVLLFVSISAFFVWKASAQVSSIINATIKISICGNGVVEGGEDCEGADLHGKTCADISGFSGGTLSCDISCSFDTTNCIAATPTPTPTPTPSANSSTNTNTPTSGPTNSPTPGVTVIPATKVAKSLPVLVQLFGDPEKGTIPARQLRTVLSTWVNSWKQTLSPTLASSSKTTATATCDANHDGACDVRDFSVLLFYVQ